MIELEEAVEDEKLRKQGIEMKSIFLENIYQILRTFGEIYAIIDEKEKSLITYLIKEIQIYANDEITEGAKPLKSIEFHFPLYKGSKELRKGLWKKQSRVESFVCLSKKRKPYRHILGWRLL